MRGLLSPLSQGQLEYSATRYIVAAQRTLYGPVSKDNDSVCKNLELVEIIRDDERRQAVTCRSIDGRVDLDPSSQVDSERGMFEHEECRVQGQESREKALLLVSTAEGSDRSPNARHPDIELNPPAVCDRVALVPPDEPTADDADGTARHNVLSHTGMGEDGLRLALARQEADALSPGSVGRARPVDLATQAHPAGLRPGDTSHRPCEPLVSGIDPPEQTDDFTTADREVVRRPPAFGGQTLNVKDD